MGEKRRSESTDARQPKEGDQPHGVGSGVKRRVRPSRRLLFCGAIMGGLLDGVLLRSSVSTTRLVVSMVFMTVFVFFGLVFVTNMRFRYRPETVDPANADSSQPPPVGGWANPTPGQRFSDRLRRLFRSSPRP